ncbi:hypothetical protein BDA99DRAFT_539434 [Phascolomyces articulosus]|uniref:Uncharacterized protein n=1 Tax=Phascolomyces articulosus TaxID=60185 RepID=A0AAD5JW64_9FUNG|nr:hypothetical protein BDA99DRAFT_539434 [Phascolomyces articulosus]
MIGKRITTTVSPCINSFTYIFWSWYLLEVFIYYLALSRPHFENDYDNSYGNTMVNNKKYYHESSITYSHEKKYGSNDEKYKKGGVPLSIHRSIVKCISRKRDRVSRFWGRPFLRCFQVGLSVQ